MVKPWQCCVYAGTGMCWLREDGHVVATLCVRWYRNVLAEGGWSCRGYAVCMLVQECVAERGWSCRGHAVCMLVQECVG